MQLLHILEKTKFDWWDFFKVNSNLLASLYMELIAFSTCMNVLPQP